MQILFKNTNKTLTLCSAVSERVIVRAVNPGQFKNQETDLQQTVTKEIKDLKEKTMFMEDTTPSVLEKDLCLIGKMGIKTNQLDEALNVVGNIKLTGNLLQPSDRRVKENIFEVNPNEALNNISKLKLYQYDYKQEFVDLNGGVRSDYGI